MDITAVLLVFFRNCPGGEQNQPVTLNLAHVVELTVNCNLTLKAAQQDVTTAAKVVEAAKSPGKLHADFNAGYLDINPPITFPSTNLHVAGSTITIPGEEISFQNEVYANVLLRYPLYNAGRIRDSVLSAKEHVTEACNLTADTRLEEIWQTTRIYLSAVFGRENVGVNEESLQAYEKHLSDTQKSRQQGTATNYDVIRAESAVEDQKQRLTQIRNQYELALANLRTALLLPGDAPINLQGNFFDVAMPPETGAEQSAIAANPLLWSLKNEVNAKCWAEKSVRAEKYPQMDALAFVNTVSNTGGIITNPQWFIGVQLSLNLLDGGLIHAQAAALASERCKVNIEYDNTANDTRLAVNSAYLDMDTARTTITSAEKSVALAQENSRLAERRFAEGVGTGLEVYDAYVNHLTAETSLLQAYYQLDTAYLTAHRYMGDLEQVACSVQTGAGI